MKLGDVATIIMGQSPPSSSVSQNPENTPFLTTGEFGNRYPALIRYTSKPLKIASKNDVLITVVGNVGGVNLGADCAIGRSVAAIRPSDSIDQLFLYYFLKFNSERLGAKSRGAIQKIIRKSDLEDIRLPDFSVIEQKTIAAILEKEDEIRNDSKNFSVKTEGFVRSWFDYQFGDPVLNPKSWNEVTLQSLLDDIIDYRGKTPPKSDSGIPLLSAANIHNHKIDLSFEQYISEEDYEKWTVRGFTHPGDVLITTEAPVGQVALYPDEGVYQISRRMMALRPDCNRVNSVFLYFVLSHPNWQRRLTRILRGSTVPRVLKPDLIGQNIILPPIDIQRKFASLVSNISSTVQLDEEKGQATRILYNSLTWEMLT